jgi:uncharacterized protein YcnI
VRRFVLAGGFVGAALAALVWAGPACAHVTVSASDATQGGTGVLTFRVPTESDTASTTGLTVQLPTDTPIASVRVQKVSGWSATQTSVKLAKPISTDDGDITDAVSQIVWTADAAADDIAPGQFGEFVIIAGQLPDVASLTFKAIQTYSDGTKVDWIETTAPGSSAEPDHPAPVLTLAAADASSPSTSSSSSDTGVLIIAVIALVVAAASLGLTVVGRARRPR